MIKGSGCALSAVLLCLSTAVQALEFSADGVYYGPKGHTQTDKIYFSNGKVRVQTVGDKSFEIFDEIKHTGLFVVAAKSPGENDMVIVVRFAEPRGIRYSVGPDFCAHLLTATAHATAASKGVLKLAAHRVSFTTQVYAPSNCKKLAPEMVNGHATEKWQFSRTAHGRNSVWTTWVDRTLDAVVKVQQNDERNYQLLNVRVGPQLASLFVVPVQSPTQHLPGQK